MLSDADLHCRPSAAKNACVGDASNKRPVAGLAGISVSLLIPERQSATFVRLCRRNDRSRADIRARRVQRNFQHPGQNRSGCGMSAKTARAPDAAHTPRHQRCGPYHCVPYRRRQQARHYLPFAAARLGFAARPNGSRFASAVSCAGSGRGLRSRPAGIRHCGICGKPPDFSATSAMVRNSRFAHCAR